MTAYIEQVALLDSVRTEILDKVAQRRIALEKSFRGWSGDDLHARTCAIVRTEYTVAEARRKIDSLRSLIEDARKRRTDRSQTTVPVAPKVSTLARLSSKETEKVQVDLRSISQLLSIRRMQLLTELSSLYRIDYQGKMRTIGGLVIPPITTLKRCDSRDEENIATALGYLVHRIDLTSRILNFPLRYSIKPLGSRSLTADVSGEYPLYFKVCGLIHSSYSNLQGAEKRRFVTGIQMLHGCLLHVCKPTLLQFRLS